MSMEEKYQETLDYLYSFIDHSLTKNLRYSAEKFNLERMRKFMALLGEPQDQYPVIHVAGTKGKGSTSALMANVLLAAGYKVGFYTSPHMHDYCERIQFNLQPIDHEELIDLVNEIRPVINKVGDITTFEITTAIAFLYFFRKKVDIAVIEVGLGGRLDATNVVKPLLSVITSLSLDHTNVLGNTLAEIAFEKGGIIKAGRPIVISPQKKEARLVLERIAEERKSPLIRVGCDYLYAAVSHTTSGQTFYVWSKEEQALANEFISSGGREDWEPVRLHIPLLGFHQVQNAATAYAALMVARENGINIKDEPINLGFSKTFWPGRFEVISKKPLIIIDSAHNRESALRLRQSIDDYFPGIPVVLVFGASEDKDIDGMFIELLPRVRYVVATKSIHPRAIEPEKLVENIFLYGIKSEATQDLPEALNRALEIAGNGSAIVVAGSIFVAAGMREIWLQRLLKPVSTK